MSQQEPAGTAAQTAPSARSRVSAMMQKAVLWSTVNFFVTQVGGMVIFLIIAAQLPLSVFGIVALAAVAADFIAMEGCYAAKDAILQSGRFDKRSLNTAFTAFLALVTSIAITLAIAAPFIASAYDEPLITIFMAAFCLMLIPVPWIAVMDALMLRDLRYREVAERSMAATLIGGAVGIAFAFSDWFLWAILAQRLVNQIVQVGLLYHYTRWAPAFALHWKEAKDFLLRFFSLWTIKTLVMTIGRVTMLVFGARYNVETVGLLRANNRITEAVQGPVIAPLVDLWFPLMSQVRGDVNGEREVYNSIVRMATVVSLPVFAGLAITAHDVASLLLPAQYAGVGPILQASALTLLLIPILWFNNMAMNAMGMNKLSLGYATTLVAVSLLVLFASNGMSAPSVILLMSLPAAIVGVAGNVILNRRLQQTNLSYYSGLLPPVLAVIAMASITLTMQHQIHGWNPLLRFGTCVATGAATYIGWLLIFHRRWFIDCVQLIVKRRAKAA